jgi:hypothetical protein
MIEKSKFRNYLLFLFCTVCLVSVVGLLIPDMSAVAQVETIISVLPSETSLVRGVTETVELDLYVTNSQNLNAFDVIVEYDENVISLTNYVLGNLLINLSCIYEVNEPGYLNLVCVQRRTAGAYGDGSLLKLNFTAIGHGTSLIDLTFVEFADPDGNLSYPTKQSGLIYVVDPDWTFSVSGKVSLQGQTNRAGVPVFLTKLDTPSFGPFSAFTSNQISQNLWFDAVNSGTYRITTDQPRYLNVDSNLDKQIFIGESMVLPDLQLIGGNAVWTDNEINVGDASLIGGSYGMTLADLYEGETLDGDVNFDGAVNTFDLAMVAINYRKTSADVYGNWLE